MFAQIRRDIRVVFERDPAAQSVIEVVLCYGGLHAIWLHRIAHALFVRGWVLIPRLISNFGRFLTGIEIHPGASIGEGLFIDHGTGIVIGETAEIGRNVTLYQGVTLGGTGKEKESAIRRSATTSSWHRVPRCLAHSRWATTPRSVRALLSCDPFPHMPQWLASRGALS